MSDTEVTGLRGFGLANYRSLDAEGFVIRDLRKINVFIGKNNSGKSNILRAIRMLKRIKSPQMPLAETQGYEKGLGLKPSIDSHNRSGSAPCVTLCVLFDAVLHGDPRAVRREYDLPETLTIRWNTQTGEAEGCKALDELHDGVLSALRDNLTASTSLRPIPRVDMLADSQRVIVARAVSFMRVFDRLICVENFCEIRSVPDSPADGETFNGYNVIARLREMQHPVIGDEREQVVFGRIQDFVRDLLSEPDLFIEVPTAEDAIYVNMHGGRLPLESYGTGLHQLVILCAALAMHDEHVVCIEEPEIHLHPELQRKFLRFIAEKTDNRYFITTHSNVFLDFLPDVAVFHVTHDGIKSTVTRVNATSRARDVLTDLGYKASDILQANCVIWVEGPSDRVYLNKWLSLMAPDLVEGIHYAITFYGGRVLAHFAGADDPADDLVEVLRINRHAVFMMDRDDVKANGKLNATKERIQQEIGQEKCWVTEGREIENYLRPGLLESFLTQECGQAVTVKFQRSKGIEKAIADATKDVNHSKIDYAKSKVSYARQFCEKMTDDDLDVLDLRKRLDQLVRLIRQWNHIQPEPASTGEEQTGSASQEGSDA